MLNSNLIKEYLFKYKIFIVLIFSFFIPLLASAASLNLGPSQVNVSAGNIFTLNVTLDTSGVSVNNAEGVIQFPSDLVEVVSVSKSSSIFTLWVEEPAFSNNQGTVSFNGGIANPGYNGSGGRIASVTFRAKKSGIATILFSDGAIRKNDGLGTNVLSNKNSSTINIIESKDIPVAEPESSGGGLLPPKPVVVSETHPNQDTWYTTPTATFSWKVPTGVSSIQASFNNSPFFIPNTYYDSSVSQRTINNISDGVYYLHIRFQNTNGFGPIAHYRIRKDTTSPNNFAPTVRIEGKKAIIKLDAIDALSGVDHYNINIDNQDIITANVNELVNKEFTLPYLYEKNHKAIVGAYDKANNKTEVNVEFISPKITSPVLFLEKKDAVKNETVQISGTSDYPGEKVEITLLSKGKIIGTYTQQIAQNGSFSLTTKKIKSTGTIEIQGVNVLSGKVWSNPSAKIFLNVGDKGVVKVTFSLSWAIAILILLLVLILILYAGWHKYFGLKRNIEKELEKTVKDVRNTTSEFKKHLDGELQHLSEIKKTRVFSPKEQELYDDITKKISDIDNFISSKLEK